MKVLILLSICSCSVLAVGNSLPKNLRWKTNSSDPVISDQNAVKGGVFRLALDSFPLTLRTVGPDSNTGIYSALVASQLSLTTRHPNTGNAIPLLATHWSISEDRKKVYFKLNRNAKFSDGKHVHSHDFKFALKFMRSTEILSPLHNNHYQKVIREIIIYDDWHLAIVLNEARPRVLEFADIAPLPRHFFREKVPKNFVKDFNWRVVPVPGPYLITKVVKGRSIAFTRVKNWWGEKLRYFENRFNVDEVRFTVVRDQNKRLEMFKLGKVDMTTLNNTRDWYRKASHRRFKNWRA